MYLYLGQYPKDREMGWSEEVNGVCHDKSNWFFTQNGNLWKFPITHDIHKICKSPSGNIRRTNKADIEFLLKTLFGVTKVTSIHMGDIDYYNGYIFVPITADYEKEQMTVTVPSLPSVVTLPGSNISLVLPGPSIKVPVGSGRGTITDIFIFKASDLTFVNHYVPRREDKKTFTSIGWVAINQNGLLYTSDKHVKNTTNKDYSRVHVYAIGNVLSKEPLTFHSVANLYDQYGRAFNREHMQGGCFDDNDHLHIMNGFVTWYKGYYKNNWSKDGKGGICIYKTSRTPQKGAVQNLYLLKQSAQKSGFRYQFDGKGDEPQGLTYWDLDNIRPEAPGIKGQLHAIMLNNIGIGDDDFYFKHYRKKADLGYYKVIIKVGNLEDAGTNAGVFIKLSGSKGESKFIELDSPKDDFERNTNNTFVIEVDQNIGTLKNITVKHDNSGKNPSLYIDRITVEDIEAQKTYSFSCKRWLAKDKGDKKLSVVLYPQ